MSMHENPPERIEALERALRESGAAVEPEAQPVASRALDPLVDQLLAGAACEDGGAVSLDATLIRQIQSELQSRDLRRQPALALDVLAAWGEASAHKWEPAATQLFELVKVLPQQLDAEAAQARARQMRDRDVGPASTQKGIAKGASIGVGLRRKR